MGQAFLSTMRRKKQAMRKTNIKIIRIYEGTRTAKEILAEVIANKVRKKLNQIIPFHRLAGSV